MSSLLEACQEVCIKYVTMLVFNSVANLVDVQVPLKSLLVDGNCRVEDRGLKTHHGQVSLLHFVYFIVSLLLRILPLSRACFLF
jgi:hypothetical protein